MHDALLDLCLGVYSLDCFGYALEIVHREDEHIFQTPVSKLIEHRDPILGGFGLTDPEA